MEQQTTGEKSVNDSRYVKKLLNVFVFESNKSGPHDLELKSYHLSPSVSLEHLWVRSISITLCDRERERESEWMASLGTVVQKPWKAEYAKSSRSSCKTCKTPIDKEVLRLGKMVQATQFDGFMPVLISNPYTFSFCLFLPYQFI